MSPEHGPDKHKHLEMIQCVITRLASNSFSIKQWTVALISALIVLAAREQSLPEWVPFVPLVAFWGLDGYFLWQERRFRGLYDDVRRTDESQITFLMNPQPRQSYWRATLSLTLFLFYGGLSGLVVAIVFFL